MSVRLDHIIVRASDKHTSAAFLAGILGVEVGAPDDPFVPVQVDNGVTLDYMDSTEIVTQHCAFLVDDEVFDAAFARIRDADLPFWAYPGHQGLGEINYRSGGRGVYFDDPDGHAMEILTVP
jgi:catechol 2,3-dioxygenase-like lactoylglutathione lyase family enzyme